MAFKKISIVVSKTDPAGLNIAEHLIKKFDFKQTEKQFNFNSVYFFSSEKTLFELVFINQKQVFADYLNELDSDLIVFASKHSSKTKKPCLTVHSTGNFSKAELGGKTRTLSLASSFVMKNFYLNLLKKAKKRNFFPVFLEQTHHGPFLLKPSVFIEIGSSEEEWQNQIAGEILAETIINSFEKFNSNFSTAVGVGGTHYCPEFSKIEERTQIALSHILSKYYVDEVDLRLFRQMLEKTFEKVDLVLIDWKGLTSRQRNKIISFCKELSLDWKKTRDFL